EADDVALDERACRERVGPDAVATVPRDDVAGAGRRPADGVAGGQAEDDAGGGVAEGGGAGGVGAYVVPFDQVAGGRVEADAGTLVAADEVARARAGAADGVARGESHLNARPEVAQGGGPGDVGADVVAFDQVAGGAGELDANAVGVVAADDVAGAG